MNRVSQQTRLLTYHFLKLLRPDEPLPELAPPATNSGDDSALWRGTVDEDDSPVTDVLAIFVGVVCNTDTFPDGRFTVIVADEGGCCSSRGPYVSNGNCGFRVNRAI